MSEEENEEKTEPEAAEEAPAEEPAAEEPAAEEAEAPPEEEGASPEASPGTPAGAAEDVAGNGSDAEPQETLTPKQLRKRARSTHSGEALPTRSTEDRIAERSEARGKKAAERRRRRTKERTAHTPATGTSPAEREPGTKTVRQGTVVSDKANKTITVKLEIVRRHPKYEKIVRQSATVHAHDENNDANIGDVVRVIESRPRSRTKRWRLVEVLERAR